MEIWIDNIHLLETWIIVITIIRIWVIIKTITIKKDHLTTDQITIQISQIIIMMVIIKEDNKIKAMEANKDRTSGRVTIISNTTMLMPLGIQIMTVSSRILFRIFLGNKTWEAVLMVNRQGTADTLIITHHLNIYDKIFLNIKIITKEVTIQDMDKWIETTHILIMIMVIMTSVKHNSTNSNILISNFMKMVIGT